VYCITGVSAEKTVTVSGHEPHEQTDATADCTAAAADDGEAEFNTGTASTSFEQPSNSGALQSLLDNDAAAPGNVTDLV